MKVKVEVFFKEGVLDPQGKTVKNALQHLGYDEVDDVRVGKVFTLSLKTSDREAARKRVAQMCEKLLSNPVVETYSIDTVEETR
ncbi:MAG: phosphoribosylformylglycinamidine synthase [Thermotogae bacterium]|nr:phosphoribosylformylglycinamidine synthase subunit PurS [Thermotogaceae bacterium]RKX36509.1 MAG: phosphoribosylformylglycinamidine synthase [Thermotogota bacterium]RKX39035.1 MAG: phosphoribosylformylglycinamidine synthase [Thermotogota bacterium]RKX43090.1 MAG: phosphoribosylformylglycinamidine synthase [Thermotogota bacterium]